MIFPIEGLWKRVEEHYSGIARLECEDFDESKLNLAHCVAFLREALTREGWHEDANRLPDPSEVMGYESDEQIAGPYCLLTHILESGEFVKFCLVNDHLKSIGNINRLDQESFDSMVKDLLRQHIPHYADIILETGRCPLSVRSDVANKKYLKKQN